jgi:hypothetical protein
MQSLLELTPAPSSLYWALSPALLAGSQTNFLTTK